GGQRQSLLLARLLLRDPNVLLLDEPTAALDEATEKRLNQNLGEWLEGKNLVVATQRMGAVSLVQRIIVVENGRIVLDNPRDQALAILSGRNGTVQKIAG